MARQARRGPGTLARLLLYASCMLAGASGQEPGGIAGSVKDNLGFAVKGASVTASRGAKDLSVVSDDSGAYRFAGLLPGAYEVAARKEGMTGGEKQMVTVETSKESVADFKLARPKLQFEAAGVRGLIDPGGYSVPAQAAAAPAMISGVASLQGTGSVDCAPEEADGTERLARFYLSHGRFEEARTLLAPVVESGGARARALAARASEGTGRFAEAYRLYQSAAELDGSEDNYLGAGYEQILTGSPDAAAKAFETGLKAHPKSARLRVGLGVAEFLGGKPTEAAQSFLRALELDPSNSPVYGYLEQAFAASHADAGRVEATFQRLADTAPQNAGALCAYASATLNARPQDPAAGALLKRAVALDPGIVSARMRLGAFYEIEGNYMAAAQEYEAAVRLAPAMSEAHYRLAGAYRRSGRDQLAAEQIKAFQELRDRHTADVEPFISVFRAPEKRTPCPLGPH